MNGNVGLMWLAQVRRALAGCNSCDQRCTLTRRPFTHSEDDDNFTWMFTEALTELQKHKRSLRSWGNVIPNIINVSDTLSVAYYWNGQIKTSVKLVSEVAAPKSEMLTKLKISNLGADGTQARPNSIA
jgi:hypothetical protein